MLALYITACCNIGMTIDDALALTKTKNKKKLAEFLCVRPSAVYQWNESQIPESGESKILKRLGLYPVIAQKAS